MLRVGRVVNVRTFDLKTDQLDMKLTGFNRPFTTRTLTCTLWKDCRFLPLSGG